MPVRHHLRWVTTPLATVLLVGGLAVAPALAAVSPSGTPTSSPTKSNTPHPSASPASTAPGPAPTAPAKSTQTPAKAPPGDGEAALTSAQLADELTQARQLELQLLSSNAELASISARMQALSAQSSAALQALQTAQHVEQQARATLAYQQQRQAALDAQADALHLQLSNWARNAYVSGGGLAHLQAYFTALQANQTDEVGNNLYLIAYLGAGDEHALDAAESLQAAQDSVARQATAAAQQATDARVAATAADAKVKADLAAQRQLLTQEVKAEAGRLSQAAYSQARLAKLGGAKAEAAREALAAAVAGASMSSATCGKGITKDSVKGYADGQIPRSDLCPLWGAPNQLLRADAAAAFGKLSKAYAEEFGQPICVTDSYRSYSQQVALYAAKPNLAAVPGTSNHGWGVAVDLCGGIESFGTVQHAWLFAHAPIYGWFHPSWAEPTGSRPEPWHWEFGG